VDGRAGEEFGYRVEQAHPHPQLRDVLGPVVIGREHGTAYTLHDGQIVGSTGQQSADVLHLGVELVPEHVGLRVEVPEEGAPADPGGGRDLVHSGLVETLVGEQAQRDQFHGAGARAARPAALDSGHPSTLLYRYSARGAEILPEVDAMSEDTVVEDVVVESVEDAEDEALLENLLVEEVSIDGMCGVY